MPIKHLLNRGIGYSPGNYLYTMTHGLTPFPVVSPHVPPPGSGLRKKAGSGSLLKIGTHLTSDPNCCCTAYDEACYQRTGKKLTGISVDLQWDDGGTCPCAPPEGIIDLTLGHCCPWCGGTYDGGLFGTGGCSAGGTFSANWESVHLTMFAQLSRVQPPATPSANCHDICSPLTPITGCDYDNTGGTQPDLFWYVQAAQFWKHKFNPSTNFTWYTIWRSAQIIYDSVNDLWPILGSFSLGKLTWLWGDFNCGANPTHLQFGMDGYTTPGAPHPTCSGSGSINLTAFGI